MKLKNLRVTLANIAKTTNAKTLEATGTGVINEKDNSGMWTTNAIGYTVECAVYRGDTIKVKFPVETAEKIIELKKMLENDVTVMISFTGLKLTPYALKATDGSIISGVSAKADDFEIVESTMDELDIEY